MRPITLLILLVPVCLTSCLRYQFATVSSNLKENEIKEHVLENDTLIIRYAFHGQNCPVQISIHNKLDVPLFVDWKRSAVIIDDQSYSYWIDKATFHADVQSSQIEWTSVVSSSYSTVTGEINRKETISFIPPATFKQTELITLKQDFFELTGPKADHRDEYYIQNVPVTGFQYEYLMEDSPLRFRSLLTLSTDPLFATTFTYENEFWVSEVFETHSRPQTIFKDKTNSHKFFVSRTSRAGTTIGLTSLLVAGAVLSKP